MTDQNQIPNTSTFPVPEGVIPSTAPPQPISKPALNLKSLFEKTKLIAKTGFNKFYSNKKIFWPVVIAFGLILLIIIIGLLFGKNGVNSMSKLPSPSPSVQATPEATDSGDILIISGNKLNTLKKQINNLDVKQSRLKPPTLDFNIKF